MATYSILTVFDANALPKGGTFNAPIGGNWSADTWNRYVYMVASKEGDPIVSGNATSTLQITVGKGDTINWLDTSISQGMRGPDGSDYDMIIYGMAAGSNWGTVLEPLSSSNTSMNHAYITANFNNGQEPQFLGIAYPNNVCSTKVKQSIPPGSTMVSYFLKVALLDLKDIDKIKVVGWYQVDPTIIISG